MTRTVLTVLFCLCVLQAPLSAAGKKPTTKPKTTEEAMKQKLPKAFVKGSFKQATEKIATLAGVKIKVDWPAVEATGVKQDKKVLMRAGEITPAQLLDIILVQASTKGSPLAWYIDGKTIRITTQLRVLHRKKLPVHAKTAKEKKRKALVQKIDFNEIPLSETIEFFRDVSGVNYYVNWKSLKQVGIEKTTPVTLKASDITLGHALELILDGVSGDSDKYDRVYWMTNKNVIHIATGRTLDKQKVTRIYDIADVLMIIPDFKGPKMSGKIISGKKDDNKSESFFEDSDDEDKDGENDKNIAERRRKKEAALIKIIKESVGEDMWQPDGKGSIKIVQKKLYITQTMLGWKLLERSLGK